MSRASKKDREEFVAVLVRECPQIDPVRVAQIAGRIMRYGATMARLTLEKCNGDWPIRKVSQDAWRDELNRQGNRAMGGIRKALKELGLSDDCPDVEFGGDPRGYTVKIKLPSGRYNTMGGKEDGWGVPTS